MAKFFTPSWIRGISALMNNLSATFFAAALLAPKTALTAEQIMILIFHIFFAIVFLVISVYLDKLLKHENE